MQLTAEQKLQLEEDLRQQVEETPDQQAPPNRTIAQDVEKGASITEDFKEAFFKSPAGLPFSMFSEDGRRNISAGLSGFFGTPGPLPVKATAGMANFVPEIREQANKIPGLNLLFSEAPEEELGAIGAQAAITPFLGGKGALARAGGRAAAGIFGGGLGGALGQLNEFDDVTLSQAATSATRQGIAGFGGGLLEAGLARILGGDAAVGAGRALGELRNSTVEGKTIDLSQAFTRAGGFTSRTGRFQGMRDFFAKVVGGEGPAIQEDKLLTEALFENLKKIDLPTGRKVLSTGTRDSLEELQGRFASKINRTRSSLKEIIPQPSVKDPLTGKFVAQPPKVVERAIQPGDFIAMDSTGKLLALPPGKAATIPKSFTPITGSKGLSADEFAAIQRLAKGEPGKILDLASPTNDKNLVAFRIFNQLLPESDRGFLRRQFVNKHLIGPSIEFVKEAQGISDPRKAGRHIAFNADKFFDKINSFGPEKFDMALGAGVGDALLKMANFMREAEVGKAARIAGSASSTQANYAFNKWSFTMQSAIGAGAVGGATGAFAGGVGSASVGIVGGFAAIIPFAYMMSTILNSPKAADLFIEASKGNSSAASKFLAFAIAANPEAPPQISEENGKTTLVFPAPGQTEQKVEQPPDLQKLFQAPL